jgi:hypothetical protein
MPRSAKARRGNRAPRVKLAGTVLSLVRLENGRQVRARVHQVSVSGGLLSLEQALDEDIKVEVLFHLGSCTVRNKARMLFPMWATQGYLQPFEFVDMAEEDRAHLEAEVQKLLSCSSSELARLASTSPENQSEAN